MTRDIRMTPQTVAVLRAMLESPSTPRYGRDLCTEAGLKSGTVQPILARLENAGMIESFWEAPAEHEDAGRPRRRYYRFTAGGAERVRLAIAAQHQANSGAAGSWRPQPGTQGAGA